MEEVSPTSSTSSLNKEQKDKRDKIIILTLIACILILSGIGVYIENKYNNLVIKYNECKLSESKELGIKIWEDENYDIFRTENKSG